MAETRNYSLLLSSSTQPFWLGYDVVPLLGTPFGQAEGLQHDSLG
jgi:hypothetical protein